MTNKNFILICSVTLALVITNGCAINSDGSITAGFRGSPAWIKNAPRSDVDARYDAMPVSVICDKWLDESRKTYSRLPREIILEELIKALNRRGLTLSSCNI